MQQTTQNLKLGGLGANIGGAEWEKAMKKKELIQEYAKNIKLSTKPPSCKRKSENEEAVKEKNAREKALEFAKNVPRPKKKLDKLNSDLNGLRKYEELGNVVEEEFDENGNTIHGESELNELNKKH
jgi:hypothetical protein